MAYDIKAAKECSDWALERWKSYCEKLEYAHSLLLREHKKLKEEMGEKEEENKDLRKGRDFYQTGYYRVCRKYIK